MKPATTLEKFLGFVNMALLAVVLILIINRLPMLPLPQAMETRALPLPMPSAVLERQEIQANLKRLLEAHYNLPADKAAVYSVWIQDAADYHLVPAKVLSALIMTESSFRTDAVSVVGAIGPAQVRPEIWESECPVDLSRPDDNIWCGAMVLRRYHDRLGGRWESAVRAYNIGITSLTQNMHVAAGHRYLFKVRRHLAQLQVASVDL